MCIIDTAATIKKTYSGALVVSLARLGPREGEDARLTLSSTSKLRS